MIRPLYNEDKEAAHLAEKLSLAYGMEPGTAKLISYATALHDIGKLKIPGYIINRAGALAPDEIDIMRTHTTWGANILERLPEPLGTIALNTALYHHERWDAGGYWRIAADKLPDYTQIAAICEVYTALVSPYRPYKRGWTHDEALAHIKAGAGKQFNPTLVNIFLSLMQQQNGGQRHD